MDKNDSLQAEFLKAMRQPPAPLITVDVDCEADPPPGLKSTQKLPRGLEEFEEPSNRRWYWLIAGTAMAALVVGVLIGRFLLP